MLLVLFGCLIMINSSSVADTARDVYNAWQIAGANHFPMEGPQLGAAIHGGPVWFYVLAVPLLFTKSWIVMCSWVGLLTGMKYLLAYGCGARLVDRNFGLIWACLLALPNWTSVNYLIFSHTNLVETTVLLSFYSLIRWQQGSGRWFYILCLALGLGIHAHPTVYAAALVALPFVVRSWWRRELSLLQTVTGALLGVAPLVPYIISQQLHDWPDTRTGRVYFESQPLWMNLGGIIDVLQGAILDGPIVALRHVLGLQGLLFWVAASVLCLVFVVGLCLAIHAILFRRKVIEGSILLAATVICIAAVALIRSVTPFYMTFVVYPSFCGLVAWGWTRMLTKSRFLPVLLFVPVSLLFLSGFAFSTLQMGKEGHLYIPQQSITNVRTHKVNEFVDAIYYPGWSRHGLAKFICQEEQPVFFHGYASLILEQSYALETRMRCPADRVFIGGQGAGRHYIGISQRDSRHLGIRPDTSLGSMNIFDVSQVIAPSQPVSIPVGDIYPPRPFFPGGRSELTREFGAGSEELLAITNLYHFWMPFTFTVALNGQPVEPLFVSMITTYFDCADCSPGAVQNWSVTLSAPEPERVEIVTFIPE